MTTSSQYVFFRDFAHIYLVNIITKCVVIVNISFLFFLILLFLFVGFALRKANAAKFAFYIKILKLFLCLY